MTVSKWNCGGMEMGAKLRQLEQKMSQLQGGKREVEPETEY